MTDSQRTIDVAALPDYAFGHEGVIWWGTTGFMLIEGALFAMALVVYFYLRLRVDEWPPGLANPDPRFGTLNLALVLASVLPAYLAKAASQKLDLAGARLWLVVLTVASAAAVVVRAFEFTALNCRWDSNAYGSIVWVLMGLHTTHLVTDVGDSAVLAVLTYTQPVTAKRFVDISENSRYWYFVVACWIPVYLTIYFAPRWL